MSSTILDNEQRTICPYCGERVRLNDLLFAGQTTEITADRVLASFYLNLFRKLPERLAGRQLVCSRELPVDQIEIEQNIIRSVTMADGTRLTERACYICHNVLPEYLIGQDFFGAFAPENLRDEFLKTFDIPVACFPSEEQSDCNLQLWNCFGHLGTEILLEASNAAWEKRCAALQQNCGKYLFMLPLETSEKTCMDKEATDILYEILDKQFHIHTLQKPTIFLLFLDSEDRLNDKIETAHKILVKYLHSICQKQHEICFIPKGDCSVLNTLQETMNRIF